MLSVGDRLPDFRVRDASGRTVDRSSLAGRAGVLFFYPKAGSFGCTREAKAFAERWDGFERRGAGLLGVSVDAPGAQRNFAEQCRLPFPLLADPGREMSRAFGVLGVVGLARRVTFVYDAEGRIRAVVDRILPTAHVEEALAALDRLRTGIASP